MKLYGVITIQACGDNDEWMRYQRDFELSVTRRAVHSDFVSKARCVPVDRRVAQRPIGRVELAALARSNC